MQNGGVWWPPRLSSPSLPPAAALAFAGRSAWPKLVQIAGLPRQPSSAARRAPTRPNSCSATSARGLPNGSASWGHPPSPLLQLGEVLLCRGEGGGSRERCAEQRGARAQLGWWTGPGLCRGQYRPASGAAQPVPLAVAQRDRHPLTKKAGTSLASKQRSATWLAPTPSAGREGVREPRRQMGWGRPCCLELQHTCNRPNPRLTAAAMALVSLLLKQAMGRTPLQASPSLPCARSIASLPGLAAGSGSGRCGACDRTGAEQDTAVGRDAQDPGAMRGCAPARAPLLYENVARQLARMPACL